MWEPTSKENEATFKEHKYSKTSAHPLGDGGKVAGDDEGTNVSAILGIDLVVPLPMKGRNLGALDRAERRRQVLLKYQVEDSGPILSKLLEECGEVLSESQQLQMKMQRMTVELEGSVEGRRAGKGQTELILQTERMDAEIKSSWERGEKVKSLRVAIQSCKLLGMAVVPECYPSNFVLVAQVLDTFGDFVSDRLQETAAGKSFVVAALLRRGQESALVDVIPPEATEVAHNWFLKISSIRELLPRIYIELSLLKSYMYVAKKQRIKMKDVVSRLGSQIRGVADPVVAAHTRWYLFLRAAEVLKGETWAVCLIQCCLDTISTMTAHTKNHLIVPALQWQIDVLAKAGGKEKRLVKLVQALFQHAREDEKPLETQALICQIIAKAFEVKYILPYTKDLLQMMNDLSAAGTLASLALFTEMVETMSYVFAEAKDLGDFLSRKERLSLLKSWWTSLASNSNLSSAGFISAIGAMMIFVGKHIGEKQLNTFLGELKNLLLNTSNVTSEIENNAYLALNGLLMKTEVSFLLHRSNFLPCVQWLPGDLKRRIAIYILEMVPPNSPGLMTQVLELCRIVHDGLADAILGSRSAGTIASEMAGRAISRAIQQCYSDESEVYLAFLCECRHSLPRLDTVKSTVIHEALKLVNRAGQKMKNMNNLSNKNKVRNAAKACLAFCHVTAPAISCIFSRLRHLILAATVGFQHGFVAQGESLAQLCVQTLKNIVALEEFQGAVRDNDAETVVVTNQLISLGVIAPPHPKYGALYIVDAILGWAVEHKFGDKSVARLQILLSLYLGAARALKPGSGPAWSLSVFLNEGDLLEGARQSKMESVLEALNKELDGVANRSLGHMVHGLGFVALDVVDAILHTTALEKYAAEEASIVRHIVHKANAIAVSSADGTIEYVRRMQAVVGDAKETLGESAWTSLCTLPAPPASSSAGEDDEATAEHGAADEGPAPTQGGDEESATQQPAAQDADALLAAAEAGEGAPTTESHADPHAEVDDSML